MHAFRRRTRNGDAGRAGKEKTGDSRILSAQGYIRVYLPKHPDANSDGYIQEHRLIMERLIGRRLCRFETPHHKNGIRSDNRPENLELWTSPQPAGQRPEDLAAWVVKFYPDLVAAELRARRREQRTGQLRLT